MTNLTAQQVIEAINAPEVDPWQLLNPDYTPAPLSLVQWIAQAAQSSESVARWHHEILKGIYAGQITTADFDAVVAEVKAALKK